MTKSEIGGRTNSAELKLLGADLWMSNGIPKLRLHTHDNHSLHYTILSIIPYTRWVQRKLDAVTGAYESWCDVAKLVITYILFISHFNVAINLTNQVDAHFNILSWLCSIKLSSDVTIKWCLNEYEI